jgi:Glycosyl hydrolases family 2/Glycosyl hydrolases family 2, sugar binding domain/Glycosyl hydrolases family 2, TIM barrel domain
MLYLLLCQALFLFPQAPDVFQTAQEHVWLEGEKPSQADPAFQFAGWGQAKVLSGGKWAFLAINDNEVEKKVPAAGLKASYDFRVAKAGKYRVYARVGYEFARSPFRWRVGTNDWQTVSSQTLTHDLMAIADFAEVAWLELGSVDLQPGGYSLDFQLPKPKKGERILFSLDCVCISQEAFRPNGPFRPGEKWKYALDYEAEKTRFEFPAAPDAKPETRQTVNLGGVWQIARFDENEIQDRTGPITGLPKNLDALNWRGIRVPSDRDQALPEWAYSHRYLYRTKVRVPENLAGRAMILRFPNNALMTTVWVNGQQVGFSKTPSTLFECDATGAFKPGENEIVVGIKDHYYAIAKTPEGKSARMIFNIPHERFYNSGGLSFTKHADFPTMFKVRRTGILEMPSLVVAGRVYADDVFAKPLVKAGQLGLETTLRNTTNQPVEVEVEHNIRRLNADDTLTKSVAKSFTSQKQKLEEGQTLTLEQSEAFPNAELWWPDSPVRYAVVTTLVVDGKPMDERITPFGYREWTIIGNRFYLNGIPWQGRADLLHNSPQPGDLAAKAVEDWRKTGQTMMRFWGDEPWTGASQEETLTFFDKAGVPVRRSGIFDGEVATYQLVENEKVHAALFDNWRAQLAAWVKAERNHPSVFVWSLENEITYINTRNFGWLKQIEPEMQKAADMVRKLDPTRYSMIDGGDALLDQSLAISGNHYLEKDKRDYPTEAYTLDLAYSRHTKKGGWDPWPISKSKPLFLGESFFANGSPPAAYAEILGEAAFLGRKEAGPGVTKFARILSEGYRTHGVAAFHYWFAEGNDGEHYKAWQPVAALVREWHSTAMAGLPLTRNITVFNETRFAAPITLHWLWQTKNTPDVKQLRGKREFQIPAGERETFALNLDMPAVPEGEIHEAELVLTCEREGREVFRDVKPLRLFGNAKPVNAKPGEVVILGGSKAFQQVLSKIVSVTAVRSLDVIPPDAKLLLVAPDAVSPDLATSQKWQALAARGLRVVVLDQTSPLHYQALPTDVEPTEHTGQIAFLENPTHPILLGLKNEDVFCWSGDEVVYRHAYRKPSRGAKSLIQCDAELGDTPLVEVPLGSGLMVLSQLAIGQKPHDPVAQRLMSNMVRYALDYQPAAKATVVVLAENDPRRKLLVAFGLKFTPSDDPIAALGQAEIVILDANPEHLAKLVVESKTLKAFTDKGGQLLLWGVTPEGLKDFNKLVDFDHAIRPFAMERVTFPRKRDPLLAGLSLRDVALESAEKIYPWAGDRYPASDTFTHIVDTTDIAPFVSSEKYAHGWKQMTNGLTSADSWKFIFYHDQDQAGVNPSWAGRLPKEEEITGLKIIINTDYRRLTKIRLVFDGNDSTAIPLSLKPETGLVQEFTFAPRRCRTIAIEPLEWTPNAKAVIGIDNVWLSVKRPADFEAKVIPLLNVGALVKYPQGSGGIILNMLKVTENEANPENAVKKQNIVSTMLRNLGAPFAAERLLLPGTNLAFTPIPLGDKCNEFLTTEKGWLRGQPSFGFFPAGEQKFQEVRYIIRDFKTSPLPSAIVLAGPSTKPGTPKEVTGIPVNRTADSLYFLHTFAVADERLARENPMVFEYIVKYADGSVVKVPVNFGKAVGAWLSDTPKSLAQASIAWSAKFPAGQGPTDRLACVYAMPWTNPEPTKEIQSVSIQRSGDGKSGTPILLGITAARVTK